MADEKTGNSRPQDRLERPIDPVILEGVERGEASALYDLGRHCYTERLFYVDQTDHARLFSYERDFYRQKLQDAEELWTKASGLGYGPAQDALPHLLIEARMTQYVEPAVLEGAEKGDAVSLHLLGRQCYFERMFFDWGTDPYGQKLQDAEAIWTKAAEQGYWPAQEALAQLLITRGGHTGAQEGIEWIRKAAQAPNAPPEAQRKWAQMLYNGYAVSQDRTEALIWFRKAAEQGNEYAQWDFGMALLGNKQAVAFERSQEAGYWLRKAVERRNPEQEVADPRRLVALGQVLRDGVLLAESDNEAIGYFQRATAVFRELAEKGDHDSQVLLARMLRDGLGGERNGAEALMWLRKAAEQYQSYARSDRAHGQEDGRMDLAVMLRDGVGAPPDRREAALWFLRSCRYRTLTSRKSIPSILREMLNIVVPIF